jgi:hypothetical protein
MPTPVFLCESQLPPPPSGPLPSCSPFDIRRMDANGESVTNSGHEFVLSVRGSVAQDYSLSQAEEKVHGAVVSTVQALLAGKL